MKLFPHQESALARTQGRNRVAYYHDMGLGKTFTGSEKMMQLGADVNLIICQKSKINDWVNHFREHYVWKTGGHIFNLTDKHDFEDFFDRVYDLGMIIGIINYELAWRRPELLKLQDFTLMLDESSLIQNSKAKQTKFILKLKPANVILLSGSPVSGKYENLYSQIKLLGWDISESTYNKQYINWTTMNFGSHMVRMVDKKNPYKNVDRLKEKLRENGCDFLKTEECFDLPEQTFITIDVPTSKEYKKFMRDSIVTVDGDELVGDSTLVKRLYARQLCGAYNKEKLQAFKALVESTNDRLIVFYTYTKELVEMLAIVNDMGRPHSIVNGKTKDLTAYEEHDDSITFVQYQAGAKGLNLQKANKMIYFTLTDSVENWMQSAKRINRIGQTRPCFYYILKCKGSVEEKIHEALERGEDFVWDLFDEEISQRKPC